MSRGCVQFSWSEVSPASEQHSCHVIAEELLWSPTETHLPFPPLSLPTQVGVKSCEIQNAALCNLFTFLEIITQNKREVELGPN